MVLRESLFLTAEACWHGWKVKLSCSQTQFLSYLDMPYHFGRWLSMSGKNYIIALFSSAVLKPAQADPVSVWNPITILISICILINYKLLKSKTNLLFVFVFQEVCFLLRLDLFCPTTLPFGLSTKCGNRRPEKRLETTRNSEQPEKHHETTRNLEQLEKHHETTRNTELLQKRPEMSRSSKQSEKCL